jgi:hypothetical protein
MSHIVQIETDVLPGVGDLQGLVDEVGVQEIRNLLKHEGIFISCQKDKLADLLSRYYLSKEFYKEAFNRISQKEYGMAFTGIRMHCDNLDEFYTFISENKNEDLINSKYRPRFVSVDRVSETKLQVGIQYERINPRFTSFHRKETYNVKAEMNLNNGVAEIGAFQSASTDSVVVRDLAHYLAKSVKSELVTIDVTSLPVPRRVDLFDTLLKDDTRFEWRIDECCGLSIRNGSDEDDERSLSASQTQILHSAILDGENLRDHKIVKELVSETYFFSSASFWTYQNSSRNYHVRIKVDFKQNPTVLVVTAESAREYSDTDSGKHEVKIVDKEIGGRCVRYFWDKVHDLFRAQYEHSQKSSKSVARKS